MTNRGITEYKGLDSLFNFPMVDKVGSIKSMLIASKMVRNNKGFMVSNMISNHDYGVGRITNRIKNEKDLYEYAILNILLPGIPFIYYGDEVGMIGKLKYRYEEYSPSYYDTLNRTMMPWDDMYVESKFFVLSKIG